jgi:hypothetical protein
MVHEVVNAIANRSVGNELAQAIKRPGVKHFKWRVELPQLSRHPSGGFFSELLKRETKWGDFFEVIVEIPRQVWIPEDFYG